METVSISGLMRSSWFGDVDEAGCTRAEGDPDALVRRMNTISTDPEDIVPPDWRLARECGAVKDRTEYIGRLRELCLRMARDRITASLQERDSELIQMVVLLDGVDQAMNQLGERLSDWYRVLHPGEGWKYLPRDSRRVLGRIEGGAEGSMRVVLDGILALRGVRVRPAGEIGDRAAGILPNCTSPVGGLVAARLMTLAGGLRGLSRLPASPYRSWGRRGPSSRTSPGALLPRSMGSSTSTSGCTTHRGKYGGRWPGSLRAGSP
jgi:nucleolar protein 56